MKRYQTTRWSIKIEEIEVLRETDNFVILPREGRGKARRESKKSEFHLYHETWEEAQIYLLERTKDRIAQAQDTLEGEKWDLRIIENMRGRKMTEYHYYQNLNDEEIEERIKKLSPGQTRKFEEAELRIGDRRQALFVAGSWPQDDEEYENAKGT